MIGYETQLNELRQRLAKNGVYTYAVDVPISAGNLELLEEVADVMDDELDDYCTCDEKTPASLGHKCRACRNRDLIARLRRITEPEHRTINPDRLGSVSEAVYFRRWVMQQAGQAGVNGGRGLLENILSPTRIERPGSWIGSPPPYVPPVSQRDAEVAATLIQWLGTSCGRGFVWECEREIASATEERRQFERVHSVRARARWAGQKDDVLPAILNLAENVANTILPPDKPQYRPLVDLIVAGFETFLQGLTAQVAVVPSGDGWEPVEELPRL